MPLPKPCTVIGCPELAGAGPRCAGHEKAYQRVRNAQVGRQAYTDPLYRQRRREVRQGLWGPCVDCGTYDDLTIDHRDPLHAGGANTPNNWVVRCRRHNSAKGPRRETR